MKYFIFLDNYNQLPLVTTMAEGNNNLILVKVGDLPARDFSLNRSQILEMPSIDLKQVKNLGISKADRVIIHAANPAQFFPLVKALSTVKDSPRILFLHESETATSFHSYPNVSVIYLPAILQNRLSYEWDFIEARQKAGRLKTLLSGANRILIMTQNNPDPDAIASGLAVQALMDRNRTTAPIATLEKVTRNENIAMIELIKTKVITIEPADIKKYDRVVMVDVQPSFFKPGLFEKVDAVIDHHPYTQDYEAEFKDVDISYGATSTILFEYLKASGVKISKRLSTALLYGIITDTMMLARQSSIRDFKAFSALWPISNHHLLANMSRPRLEPDELGYFVKAINNRRISGNLLYIWLGSVKKEDIIPRLADFSLQIGDTPVSAVCGVYAGDLTVSIRNIAPDIDIGKLLGTMFSRWGSAGGHHSMAKAVVPIKTFKKACSLKTMRQVDSALYEMFKEAISAII